MWQRSAGEKPEREVWTLGWLEGVGELVYVRVGLFHQEDVEMVPRVSHWVSIS